MNIIRFINATAVLSDTQLRFYEKMRSIYSKSVIVEYTRIQLFKLMDNNTTSSQFNHNLDTMIESGAMTKKRSNESNSGVYKFSITDELDK